MPGVDKGSLASEGRRLAQLTIHLAVREVTARHRFTTLGWLWPLARQLAQFGVLLLVFTSVVDLGIDDYPAFLFTGLVAWSWFASGLTAYHHDPKPYEGLGFLPHSNAVHYEEESNRRPAYHAALLNGMPGGYAASDGAALHFIGDDLHRVVLSRPKARAYRVEVAGEDVVEHPLEATYLGERPKLELAAA